MATRGCCKCDMVIMEQLVEIVHSVVDSAQNWANCGVFWRAGALTRTCLTHGNSPTANNQPPYTYALDSHAFLHTIPLLWQTVR